MAIALASDVRIASETARFIIGAPNIGLSAGANADASSLEEALQLENRTQILANATADAAEARAAFLGKRRPSFTGR